MHGHARQDPHGRFRLIGVDELSTCRTAALWTFTSATARRGEFRELKINQGLASRRVASRHIVAEIRRARRNSIRGVRMTVYNRYGEVRFLSENS